MSLPPLPGDLVGRVVLAVVSRYRNALQRCWLRGRGQPVPGGGESQAAGSQGEDGGKLAALRAFGTSKDHRGDLPQIVIGIAVIRGGIPVRAWC